MGLPNVNIKLTNGALGSVADSPDGVAALVLTGKAVSGKINLAEPHMIYSLPEAEALGITADGDNAGAYRHIKEFYDGYQYINGSEVAELYVMLVADTLTLTQMADVTEASGAKKLLDYAGGRVRRLGLARTPDVGYTPVVTAGIDQDSIDALPKAQALGEAMAGTQQPIRVLVEGRAFELANIGDLEDLKQGTNNRAAMVLWSTANDGSSSVGYALGVASALPVQRKVSRVKNGALPLTVAYIGDTKAEQVSGIGTISDKGYIALRTFPNRSGYYFTDDPTATLATDDYSSLTNGQVIDKAQRYAYDTYVEELNDDIEIDPNTGQLPAGYVAYLKQRITNAISIGMAGEISGLKVNIDPNQNILATGKTKIQLKVVPVGYNKEIDIELGFDNPAND